VIEERKDVLHQAWKLAKSPQLTTGKTDQDQPNLVPLLSSMAQEILIQFYPEAALWL
jgi:hypothetical protein